MSSTSVTGPVQLPLQRANREALAMASVTGVPVIVIPEIFLMILKKLPMKDLLLLQRVSRHWRDTITNTPLLQQKLCFQAVTYVGQKPFCNPLLMKKFPFLYGDVIYRQLFDEGCVNKQWTDKEYCEKMMRKDASWRRMYPLQPPAVMKDVDMEFECECDDHSVRRFGEMREPYFDYFHKTGPRMGYIWDFIALQIDEGYDIQAYISWDLKKPSQYPKGSFRRDAKGVRRIIQPQNTFNIKLFHQDPHDFPSSGPCGMVKKVPFKMENVRWRCVRKEWIDFLGLDDPEEVDNEEEYYLEVLELLEIHGFPGWETAM